MTSLNMNGFSITALELDPKEGNMVLDLLDQHTSAPAWPRTYSCDLEPTSLLAQTFAEATKRLVIQSANEYLAFKDSSHAKILKLTVKTIFQDLITAKQYLNELDSECGDGDCGNSLAKVAEAIQKFVDDDRNNGVFDYPHQVFNSTILFIFFIFH